MQRQTNDRKPLSGRREFLKSSGGAAAGLCLAGADRLAGAEESAKKEALALNGGPKAVTTPLRDFTRWPRFGDEEEKEVVAYLRDPDYYYGTYGSIVEFEKAWNEFHKSPFCKTYSSGTGALTAMLFALDLPPGSEILVPDDSTWFPVLPMRFFGLVPVWVDINPRTFNIDVEDCKRRLTKNTKAIMPVHWFGLPCDMDHINDFGKQHGLEVIEDASHAHGASLKGQPIGTWGRMSGFSLQASKPLPAIEAGIGMYKNRLDYERAASYGHWDASKLCPEDSPYRKYQQTGLGCKLRIHPIAAILAKIQLKHLAERNAAGVAQVKRLNDRLTQLPGLTTPYVRPDCQRVFYNRNFLFFDAEKAGMSRAACLKALKAEGVHVGPYSGLGNLLHTYPVFQESQWWHHLPAVPDKTPGCDEVRRIGIQLPYLTCDAPELVDQYVKAFEKVWAHRTALT
jgi:dTDP-4-amino-4,6-dideoxygalactose transaminase